MPVPVVWKSKLISSPSPISRWVDRARPWRSTWKRWRSRGCTTRSSRSIWSIRRWTSGTSSSGTSPMWPATTAPSSSPPKPGAGSTGSTRLPSAHAPRRRQRPRVPHLELGQQHPGTSTGGRRPALSGASARVERRSSEGAAAGGRGQTYWRTRARRVWAAPMMSDARRVGVVDEARRAPSAGVDALAHVPTDTPYGGDRRRSCGDAGRAARSRPDGVVGIAGQAIRRREQRVEAPSGAAVARRRPTASTSVPCSMASSSSSTARLGVGGHDHRRAVPAVRHLGLDERLGQRLAVARRPLVEPVLDARVVLVEGDGERAEQLLEAGEQLVDVGLQLLGHDDLVALPHVGDVGLGERLGSARRAGRSSTPPRRSAP